MLFGEFLVEQGLITEAQLLSAILKQIAELPTVPQILRDKNLLPDGELLRAIKFQVQHKTDFKRSCELLKLWSQTHESIISVELSRKRTPIGEMLVRLGALKSEQLKESLQIYFAKHPPAHKQTEVKPLDKEYLPMLAVYTNRGPLEGSKALLHDIAAPESWQSFSRSLVTLRALLRLVRAGKCEELCRGLLQVPREQSQNQAFAKAAHHLFAWVENSVTAGDESGLPETEWQAHIKAVEALK